MFTFSSEGNQDDVCHI